MLSRTPGFSLLTPPQIFSRERCLGAIFNKLTMLYHNFVLPHASLRQPLLIPQSTNGHGSAKLGRPCTPAMAAGLTDHVWSLKAVLFYRVPPWPQPQTV